MTLEDMKNPARFAACDLRSQCRIDADREFRRSLFEREWEVFVIRHDPETGKLKGETICCESALSH